MGCSVKMVQEQKGFEAWNLERERFKARGSKQNFLTLKHRPGMLYI